MMTMCDNFEPVALQLDIGVEQCQGASADESVR